MKLFPLETFSIIKKFIGNENDYRILMNCNKEIFQSIKYQTVYFMVRINLNLYSEEFIDEKLKNFQVLISRVKDKSKQIGLSLYFVTSEFLMLHANVFSQIHLLQIFFAYDVLKEFNFNIFNNIYYVELDGCGITTINSGLENVQILIISNSFTLTTIDLRHTKIHEFYLTHCHQVAVLEGINNVKCLEIQSVPNIPVGFQLIPGNPYQSIFIDFHIYFHMFCQCDLSHLQSLSLTNFHALDIDDLSIFRTIQNLYLITNSDIDPDHYPSLPMFFGTYLHLYRFNLQPWVSADFIPNVKRIQLVECTNLDPQLSFLSKVQSIALGFMNEPTNLSSLPFCTELKLISLQSIERIAVQPRLCDLKISFCPNLMDYETDGQLLNRVEIDKCIQFQSLYKFRNTRELIFHPSSDTNYSFDGYDQTNLPTSNRIVRICIQPSYSPNVMNFSDLANLNLLELLVDGALPELTNFHDIDTVRIDISSNFVIEVSNLRNIQKLEFTHVQSLQSLHHLENIDKIMLCAFPGDFQFDGLKGCRVVYSRGNKRLEEQAKLYGRGERDVSLFDSNYLEVFGSIEEFFVVHDDHGGVGVDWQMLQNYEVNRLW